MQVEQDGAVVHTCAAPPLPAATDHHLFMTAPVGAVLLTNLASGVQHTFRSRCVVGAGATAWELPWSTTTHVATMLRPRHPAADHPPTVVQVLGTSVALLVRNPGRVRLCRTLVCEVEGGCWGGRVPFSLHLYVSLAIA